MGQRLSITALSSLLFTGVLLLGMAVIAPPKVSALTCVQKDYLRGSTGTCVRYIQHMMNEVSDTTLKVDGKYGKLTHQAVLNWQALHYTTNKKMLVDGIVGDQTWATLCDKRALYPTTADKAGCKKSTTNTQAGSGAILDCDQMILSAKTTQTRRVQECTSYLRQMLNVVTNSQLNNTGTYNESVHKTIYAFQTSMKLKKDGITGANTWRALCTHGNNYDVTAAYKGLRDQIGC